MLQANPRLVWPVPGQARFAASTPPTDSQFATRRQQTASLYDELERADAAQRNEILQRVVLLNAGLALAVARRDHGPGSRDSTEGNTPS